MVNYKVITLCKLLQIGTWSPVKNLNIDELCYTCTSNCSESMLASWVYYNKKTFFVNLEGFFFLMNSCFVNINLSKILNCTAANFLFFAPLIVT